MPQTAPPERWPRPRRRPSPRSRWRPAEAEMASDIDLGDASRRLPGGRKAAAQAGRPEAAAAEGRAEPEPGGHGRHELRQLRDRARRQGLAEDGELVRLPGAQRASTTTRSSTGSCPDFVIQGGDPLGTGSGGPGYSVDEPPPSNTQYTRGTVAMAKTAGRATGPLRKPVLRRHRGRRRPAARLRAARQGELGRGRRRSDREARRPGERRRRARRWPPS